MATVTQTCCSARSTHRRAAAAAAAAAAATTTESYEEPTLGTSSGTHFEVDGARKRRRHSSYSARAWSTEREHVQMRLDQFLGDLGRRLELMEQYGHGKFDESVKMVAGALEANYRDALATRDTLEARVQAGVKRLEQNLAALEQRAHRMRHVGFGAAASEMLDSGIAYMDDKAARAGQMMHDGADAARRAKERMRLKIEAALAHAKAHGSVPYEMLPEPWRVNPYIRRGYRFSETKRHCVASCFRLSNEFVNIWSHAIGLVIVLALAFYVYPSTPAFTAAAKFDIFIAGCFFFAACKCLACSCMWHAMSSISNQTLMERFACVDYTGISLLVAASIMTTEYTAFYCEPVSRWTYMSLTCALGLGGTLVPWHPFFNRADMSWARVAFYVTLAATGFFPIAQLTRERGWPETAYFYAPIAKSILVYLAGAILYAAKIPERFLPGRFDYAGGSHNIWHLAVLGGILFHHSAMQSFFAEAFRRAHLSAHGCSTY